MKIKRIFQQTVHSAIKAVREELGEDAVILSNRQVEGGFEIVAAIDYDETLLFEEALPQSTASTSDNSSAGEALQESLSTDIPGQDADIKKSSSAGKFADIEWSQDPALVQMKGELKSLRGILEHQLSGLAWSEFARRNPIHARLISTFSSMGLSPDLSKQISSEAIKIASDKEDFTNVFRGALAILSNMIPVTEQDVISKSGVVALVGATGVGKTTMIAKMAARFILRHGAKHIALVTTDSYRIGAYEQLKTYGRILGIPVRIATDAESLRLTLKDLSDKRLVLIDTAGVSQRDILLNEQLETLKQAGSDIHAYMVMSATAQTNGIDEVIRAHSGVKLDGCVISKTDESTSLGGVVSMAINHKLPIAYIGDGQRVPEDIHIARAVNLVNRCMSIMKQTGQHQDKDTLAEIFGEFAAHAHG